MSVRLSVCLRAVAAAAAGAKNTTSTRSSSSDKTKQLIMRFPMVLVRRLP